MSWNQNLPPGCTQAEVDRTYDLERPGCDHCQERDATDCYESGEDLIFVCHECRDLVPLPVRLDPVFADDGEGELA